GEATGCSAAWLARHTGGVEVAGSNPASPTTGGLLQQASLLSISLDLDQRPRRPEAGPGARRGGIPEAWAAPRGLSLGTTTERRSASPSWAPGLWVPRVRLAYPRAPWRGPPPPAARG